MVVKPRSDLYIVSRTSCPSYDDKPCEEAYQVQITDVDCRWTDDPRKVLIYNDPKCDWWYKHGTNHRVEDGMIKRDAGINTVWVVKIEQLADLMEFIKKYGDCVLSRRRDGFAEIEIYDDHRE